jgi:hypothetical protein
MKPKEACREPVTNQTMTRHGAHYPQRLENLEGVSAYRHVGIFYLGATAIPWALMYECMK